MSIAIVDSYIQKDDHVDDESEFSEIIPQETNTNGQ